MLLSSLVEMEAAAEAAGEEMEAEAEAAMEAALRCLEQVKPSHLTTPHRFRGEALGPIPPIHL